MKKIFLAGFSLLILMTALSQPVLRDGAHDFDFNVGYWKTHIQRRGHPYLGDPKWTVLNGTVTVRNVWNGKAQLEEIEADGQIGHFEGTTVFLYNPTAHEWSQNFANSTDGDISGPTIGKFKDGRGVLYGQTVSDGKTVLVKGVWSEIQKDSHRYTESVSFDGGKTWIVVFDAGLTRDSAATARAAAGADDAGSAMAIQTKSAEQDGRRDFDFVFGKWKEHTRRMLHPLTGSTSWVESDGVSVVSKVWGGKGNLTELESDGPNGHLELLALRLYNTESHQWNLTFATSGVGVLGMPQLVGEFSNGRGEFYDQEAYNGRTIWVRFMITPLTPGSYRSEQAFSEDGGKTWETNWINEYTRL
jgi:hypothetical protein